MNCKQEEKDNKIEKSKLGLSKATQELEMVSSSKLWESTSATSASFAMPYNVLPTFLEFQFGNEGDASPFSRSVCTGSTCTAIDQQGQLQGKLEEENGDDFEASRKIGSRSNVFNSNSVLWDLQQMI